ncbi:hypothetical protein QJS83_04355 [Bdellovibrio sp. 22V]|uniref:hypothetical protein n=1 Tax=Bdellovibrio TaxID=958 RepID=UPI00254294A9|nr:hypothetical protein [Bdellovibrio sp. 22V]WII73103.1 hypothetical protein QJS83_04355 [Bdellovibrio sp. 22V]
MKTFTYPNKKWVMTGALLAVLGFNVSFNSHQAGIASADFASTSGDLVESKVATVEGVLPVKYINNGESSVLAIVPKKMTEGKVCENCGYDTIPLSIKNKEDIDAMNVELLKALSKGKPKAEAKEEDADEVVEEKVVEKKNPFDRIKKACARPTDKTEALDCYKTKFIALLKDKSASKIETNEALQFYRAEIENRILSQISDARRISARARRASTNMSSWQAFENSDDAFANTDEMINKTLFVIEDLIREMPAKFEPIRQRLIVAETMILKQEAAQVQQTKAQSEAQKGTPEGLYLGQETLVRNSEFHDLWNTMGYSTNQALREAQGNNTITPELYNQYNKFLQEFNSSLMSAISGNNSNGLLNGVTTTPGVPGVNLLPRLQNPGRTSGAPGVITQPNPISTRTGANLTTTMPGTQTQTVLVPVQIPTQNTGVSFGTVSPISQESLRMRQQIRGQ